MIPLVRGPSPASIAGDYSPGATERNRAVEFFADPARHDQPFPFDAYSADDIKAALKAICGVKCAYCEADFRAGAPADTEHFRPKGAIEIDKKLSPPGYYWLAATWSNLLPSCPDCNRRRYQETASGRRLAGKGNLFPLAEESERATAPGGESKEAPLLLDPFVDDPEAHLELLPEGAIRPALDEHGVPSRRGETTIEVLGLDRIDLSTVREEHGIVIRRAIDHFKRASLSFQEEKSTETEEVLEEEIDELQRLIKPSTRFAALARQMIRRELGTLDLTLDP